MHTFCANPLKLYSFFFLIFIHREYNFGINLKKKYSLLTLIIIVRKEDELILSMSKIYIFTIQNPFLLFLQREIGNQP